MNSILHIYRSSVGKKIIMSLTGLFLCSFLVIHVSGNTLLFKDDGGKAFEQYSEFMSTNGIIRTIEILLVAGLLFHIIDGVVLWLRNKRSRGGKYEMYKVSDNATLPSRITFVTGSIIFIFLVVHIKTFVYVGRFVDVKPSMYELVVEAFSDPIYVLFYLVALVLLAYHLHHGFQSAFQTLGLRHKKLDFLLNAIAVIFWLIIPIGFATMPIYFLLFYR
jgi:succinate dehydrogenase / fumarate reductase cytochrome b subunit